ncbi:mitochondrial ribosomal protein L46 precursor, putative [Plasmodium ovale curtisi]|uniref:Mitochondrial ribosomal protein L46, putative n=2 Tax=Plasmodium ovale TaxID=36330 RepID=A0A1A8VXG9_PLAOA|nr:mitochondrial ribosomal protein L46 precursor, putative [Plasmodium ovale curtisi]SBS94107.1 mitochondrial ribosomal protein L46 precursor, putative [Plasmodium ovale curtisi]
MFELFAKSVVMGMTAHRSRILLGREKWSFLFSNEKYIWQDNLKIKNSDLSDEKESDMLLSKRDIVESNVITVHEKYKVQVSLCIDRFPLHFAQEEFEKDFEQFRDHWLLRTNNNLDINEEFLHMKYNLSSFHDKKDEHEREDSKEVQSSEIGPNELRTGEHLYGEMSSREQTSGEIIPDDLENLLSLEGMENILRVTKKKIEKKHITDFGEKKKKGAEEDNSMDILNYRNVKRKPNEFLYLIVKYRKTNKWMFPLIDFKKNMTIRQNLQFLCSEHLKCEIPFFVGYCPCTFEKRKFKSPLLLNEIIGRKIFYYRAHYIHNDVNMDTSQNVDICDYAWLSRSELKNFLSVNKYNVIKDAIPLT